MSAPAPDRAALRAELRQRRKQFVAGLPASVRGLAFRVLPGPVLAQLPQTARIALYMPVGSEAPTAALAQLLAERGWPLCLPRLDEAAEPQMDFAVWAPDDPLIPGPGRIPQPPASAPAVAPDIILAPLLGFDRALNRLGQGGGHYDRAFARLPAARRIGLAWSAQMVDALPVEPWDMPLHMVVTEQRFFERDDTP
jgi:5-formyltetrahydrofolate cyclo-ligase